MSDYGADQGSGDDSSSRAGSSPFTPSSPSSRYTSRLRYDMLFSSLPSLSILLLTLFLLVAHSPTSALSIPPNLKSPPRVKSLRGQDSWTNAQRLAVGLPPRAPRTYKRATSTNPLEPAPVKRSAPSPSPSPYAYAKARPVVETSYSGHIVARYAGTDVVAGSVQASDSGVTLGGDADSARVTFATSGPRALFSISKLDAGTGVSVPATEAGAFIGATGTAALGAGASRLLEYDSPLCARASALPASAHTSDAGVYSAVLLNHVHQTSAHARPAASGSESAIWLFDASARALTAHWVNPDGSHPKTEVAMRVRDGALVLTGDVGAYNRAHAQDPVYEVTLQFVSD
ncbi:hypothetical protein BC628DRAFT_1420175 [Trametes gibbosa]|nr:hypothetical protein BC628DRAFT_1420175 [Trametes gibbosa]